MFACNLLFFAQFDEQLCEIIFGSWTHTSNQINYTIMIETPLLDNYTENNEWVLVEYKPFRNEMKYDQWIEDHAFSEIRYKVSIIKKKSILAT